MLTSLNVPVSPFDDGIFVRTSGSNYEYGFTTSIFIDGSTGWITYSSPTSWAILGTTAGVTRIGMPASSGVDALLVDVFFAPPSGFQGFNMSGGDGNDVMLGTSRADVFSSGNGSDFVSSQGGNDTLNGDGFADSLFGQGGSDSINGGNGDDQVVGGSDNDTLFGGGNSDRVFGDGGDDRLEMRDGVTDATINGGSGSDTGILDFSDPATDIESILRG